jgi:hypothetical protein
VSNQFIVIPGRRASGEPGIHNHDREYGFRTAAYAASGMTELWFIKRSETFLGLRSTRKAAKFAIIGVVLG